MADVANATGKVVPSSKDVTSGILFVATSLYFVSLPASVIGILIMDDASETSDSVSTFEFRH